MGRCYSLPLTCLSSSYSLLVDLYEQMLHSAADLYE